MGDLSDEQERLIMEFTGLSMLKAMRMNDGEVEAYMEGMKDAFDFVGKFSEIQGKTVENIFDAMDAEDFDDYMRRLFNE